LWKEDGTYEEDPEAGGMYLSLEKKHLRQGKSELHSMQCAHEPHGRFLVNQAGKSSGPKPLKKKDQRIEGGVYLGGKIAQREIPRGVGKTGRSERGRSQSKRKQKKGGFVGSEITCSHKTQDEKSVMRREILRHPRQLGKDRKREEQRKAR